MAGEVKINGKTLQELADENGKIVINGSKKTIEVDLNAGTITMYPICAVAGTKERTIEAKITAEKLKYFADKDGVFSLEYSMGLANDRYGYMYSGYINDSTFDGGKILDSHASIPRGIVVSSVGSENLEIDEKCDVAKDASLGLTASILDENGNYLPSRKYGIKIDCKNKTITEILEKVLHIALHTERLTYDAGNSLVVNFWFEKCVRYIEISYDENDGGYSIVDRFFRLQQPSPDYSCDAQYGYFDIVVLVDAINSLSSQKVVSVNTVDAGIVDYMPSVNDTVKHIKLLGVATNLENIAMFSSLEKFEYFFNDEEPFYYSSKGAYFSIEYDADKNISITGYANNCKNASVVYNCIGIVEALYYGDESTDTVSMQDGDLTVYKYSKQISGAPFTDWLLSKRPFAINGVKSLVLKGEILDADALLRSGISLVSIAENISSDGRLAAMISCVDEYPDFDHHLEELPYPLKDKDVVKNEEYKNVLSSIDAGLDTYSTSGALSAELIDKLIAAGFKHIEDNTRVLDLYNGIYTFKNGRDSLYEYLIHKEELSGIHTLNGDTYINLPVPDNITYVEIENFYKVDDSRYFVRDNGELVFGKNAHYYSKGAAAYNDLYGSIIPNNIKITSLTQLLCVSRGGIGEKSIYNELVARSNAEDDKKLASVLSNMGKALNEVCVAARNDAPQNVSDMQIKISQWISWKDFETNGLFELYFAIPKLARRNHAIVDGTTEDVGGIIDGDLPDCAVYYATAKQVVTPARLEMWREVPDDTTRIVVGSCVFNADGTYNLSIDLSYAFDFEADTYDVYDISKCSGTAYALVKNGTYHPVDKVRCSAEIFDAYEKKQEVEYTITKNADGTIDVEFANWSDIDPIYFYADGKIIPLKGAE